MVTAKEKAEEFEVYVQSKTEKGYSLAGELGTSSKSYRQDLKGYESTEVIINHPIVRACTKVKVNSVMKGGFRITGLPRNAIKAKDALEEVARIDKVIPDILWQLSKRNAYYGEIVKDGNGRIRALKTRDGEYIEHLLDGKGNLRGFVQILDTKLSADLRGEIARKRTNLTSKSAMFNESGKVVYFDLDEILYISTDHLDSSTFAHAELITLAKPLYYIDLIEKFIGWMFESNQFRTAIRVPTGMKNIEYKKYLQALFDSMKQSDRFLLLRGDGIQHAPLREITGFDELLRLLDYYRSQVLALTQVTPIQTSLTSDSGRGSSDTQYRYVNYDDIRYKQYFLQKEFEYQLFPRIGLKGADFKWNPIDNIEKNEIIDMAQKFLGMNANVDKVNAWLIEQGINVPKGFLEKPEPIPEDNSNTGIYKESDSKIKLDKNSKLHPSRKPKNGDAGGKKMEDLERK